MSILRYLDKVFLFLSFFVWNALVYLLISNVSRGFDITDESYYLLTALYPDKVLSTLTHEGYYTGFLYMLSGYNLANFRLVGILILLAFSIWFALELYKYIANKYNLSVNLLDKLFFIIPISATVLSYYKLWLLTPSYNWLALISVMLFLIALMRIVRNKDNNYDKFISCDYILLSFSLSLAFMAKPTTALTLVFLSVLFIIYEYKNIHLKKALPSIIVLTSTIIFVHITFLDGGFSTYYDRLQEGMERLSLLGGGHTLNNRYTAMLELIQVFFFEKFYFHKINYLYVLIFMTITIVFIKYKKNTLSMFVIFLLLVLSLYAYLIFSSDLGLHYRLVWIRAVELLLFNLVLIFLAALFMPNKIIFMLQISKAIPFLLIITLGSVAYVFGTNNQVIYAMSSSIVFISAPIIVLNYILDRKLNIRMFTAVSGFIMSLIVYMSIQNAYIHPYRLISSMKEQNQKVDFLGELRVDAKTKKYIEDLQRIKNNNIQKNEELFLIDMTGGSPGANIIINAGFFGEQWLYGGYPNSNEFTEKILKKYIKSIHFQEAWILVARDGKRQLDLQILKNLNLHFPEQYKLLGTVRTAHRNEIQELWAPKW